MWLTEWIVEVPDFTIDTCCKELASLDKVNNTYSNQLRMQVIYSQAAFLLQHPEEKNAAAIQAAGLAGTLRAYRAIQRFDPTAKYPWLDNLRAGKRRQAAAICAQEDVQGELGVSLCLLPRARQSRPLCLRKWCS